MHKKPPFKKENTPPNKDTKTNEQKYFKKRINKKSNKTNLCFVFKVNFSLGRNPVATWKGCREEELQSKGS